jgi:hypothetical protein
VTITLFDLNEQVFIARKKINVSHNNIVKKLLFQIVINYPAKPLALMPRPQFKNPHKQEPLAGVLDEAYSAKPAQRSNHTGPARQNT